MRRLAVKTLVLMLLLGSVGIVLGQQQNPGGPPGNVLPTSKQKAPPAKSKLEEMLAEALKNNPDIRVAAAKLAEADAELNRTRLQVVQKVVTLYHAIETQKKTIEVQEAKCQFFQGQFESARGTAEGMLEARQALALAKGKLEELEAQLPALLGKGQKTAEARRWTWTRTPTEIQGYLDYDMDGRLDLLIIDEPQAKVTISQDEKIRKALLTPVKVDYKEMKFDAILKDLAKKVPGLSFRNLVGPPDSGPPHSLHFEEALPVSAILQAMADEARYTFLVREYGILATIPGKAPPAGAMTVEQFLRQKPAEQPRRQPGAGKNPPPQDVEGLVKAVDKSGLMTLSIGSDAGLAKGHTMELFRISAQSKYLGTVRIVEAEAKQAVAQPVGRLTDTPKAGDRVASRISGK